MKYGKVFLPVLRSSSLTPCQTTTRRPSNPLKSLVLLMLEIFSSGNEVIFFGELLGAKSAERVPEWVGGHHVSETFRGSFSELVSKFSDGRTRSFYLISSCMRK